jgi:hypothetical protein
MTWFVQYSIGEMAGMCTGTTLVKAIAQACDLIDQGATVSQINTPAGSVGATASEISLACAERKAMKNLVH